MKRSVQLLFYGLIWIVIVLVTVSSWNGSVVGGLVEPVVLTLVFATLIRGPVMGLWMAVMAGWIYDSASAWPVGTHLFAMLVAVTVITILVRRWLTERSAASFIFLIPIGTLAYAAGLGLMLFVIHAFSPGSLTPDWAMFIRTSLIQSAVHAGFGLLILRLRRPGYSRTQLKHQF